MPDHDCESYPSNPNRRTFLLTTGSSVAASVVAAYVPIAKGCSRRERIGFDQYGVDRGRCPDYAAH